ncbi:MAG TPA: amino acid ABC transporter permease, partial [Mycobacteriales bacterium]|nr:amino acid ABC transporter permease [Mycobacteriales bacterium]
PKARRRQLIGSIIGGVIVAAIIAFVAWKLNAKGQFDSARWSPFKEQGIWQYTFWPGIRATLKAAALSIVFAVVFGLIMCSGRLSDHRWVRIPATIIIEFFRATPLLLLILFIFIQTKGDIGILWPLVFGLTLYNGSVLAETFRAGINAIPRGQSEAAYSIGLTKGRVMRLILMPQAVRAMLPVIISQCVVVLKDTSLGYIIGYEELIRTGSRIPDTYDNIIPTAIVLAAMYIAVNYSLSKLATYIEGRQRRRGRATIDPMAEQTIAMESA